MPESPCPSCGLLLRPPDGAGVVFVACCPDCGHKWYWAVPSNADQREAKAVWAEAFDSLKSWHGPGGYGSTIRARLSTHAERRIGQRPITDAERAWQIGVDRVKSLQTLGAWIIFLGWAPALALGMSWLDYPAALVLPAVVLAVGFLLTNKTEPARPQVPEERSHRMRVDTLTSALVEEALRCDVAARGDTSEQGLLRLVDYRYRPQGPPPGPVAASDWRTAELIAAQWLKFLGAKEVVVTQSTRDGGVDIRGQGVVAQVKHQSAPVAPAVIQQIAGIAASEREETLAIAFSLSGFSKGATEFAIAAGVALFKYDPAEANLRALSPRAQALTRVGMPGAQV